MMFSIALVAASNLLLNPSFEEWPDGEALPVHWTCADSGKASHVVSRLYALGTDGQYALRFTDGKMEDTIYQRVRVTPGKYYNVSCDARIDVRMYCFEIMPQFEDKDGNRVPFANFPRGNRFIGFTEPWTHLYVKNMLAPTNAVFLNMRLASNDSWSHRGVIGNIDVDNVCVCESGSVIDDRPVAVGRTDRLEVLAADLKPSYDKAGVLVRAGKSPVRFVLRVEEPIGNGKAILGGEREFSLGADEERSCFLPLETSDITTRLTVLVDGAAVWRKSFEKDDRFLRVGINDRFDVRKNEIFVPNDRKWYTNFPIENNLVAEKGNRNRVFGNPTDLNARLFFETPEEIEIFGVKYSDWGGDRPFQKPIAVKKSVWNGRCTVVYELPVFISGVNQPLVVMKSSLPADTISTTRAWLTWDGGMQVPQEFKTRSVSFGTYKPFERMNMRMCDMMPNLMYALCDDPVREMPTLGVNAMRMEWEPSKRKDISYPQFGETCAQMQRRLAREMKASPAKWYLYLPNELSIMCWVTPRWNNHANMSADPTAAYININGKEQTSSVSPFVPPCPNYRGTNFMAEAKWVLESEPVRDLGITWIILDWEYWGLPCYCARCKRLFREKWCPEHKLPDFGDPQVFMRDAKANAAAAAAYEDFFMYSRGRMYADFKKVLDKGLDLARKDWSAPFEGRFMLTDWVRPKPHLVGCIDTFEWMFAFRHPKHGVRKADEIFTNVLKGKTGSYTCSVCPMQGCETCFTDAPIGTYYNMLEAASLGVIGFEWYYAPITEAMTWKYVMDGLRAMRPFEDLIMDGKVTPGGQGEGCTWRRVALKDEGLYCARNYELEKSQIVSFSARVRRPCAVYDCATHEKLADLSVGENTVKVRLDADHQAKLLYVGNRFEERQAACR